MNLSHNSGFAESPRRFRLNPAGVALSLLWITAPKPVPVTAPVPLIPPKPITIGRTKPAPATKIAAPPTNAITEPAPDVAAAQPEAISVFGPARTDPAEPPAKPHFDINAALKSAGKLASERARKSDAPNAQLKD